MLNTVHIKLHDDRKIFTFAIPGCIYIYPFPENSPTVSKFHLINLILEISRGVRLDKFYQ